MNEILNLLREIADKDPEFAAFTARTVPGIAEERFLGCRTPAVRSLAKQLRGTPEAEAFLQALPHRYFDENQLHAFLIAEIRDFDAALSAVTRFLPYVDNWATCDQMNPPVFRREAERLLPSVRAWIASGETYTVRYGIGMLMRHFLEARFLPEYLTLVAAVDSEEYYVRMEIAWYFAEALAKQPRAALPFFSPGALPEWTRKKAIRKAIESRRIPDETKALLRAL